MKYVENKHKFNSKVVKNSLSLEPSIVDYAIYSLLGNEKKYCFCFVLKIFFKLDSLDQKYFLSCRSDPHKLQVFAFSKKDFLPLILS